MDPSNLNRSPRRRNRSPQLCSVLPLFPWVLLTRTCRLCATSPTLASQNPSSSSWLEIIFRWSLMPSSSSSVGLFFKTHSCIHSYINTFIHAQIQPFIHAYIRQVNQAFIRRLLSGNCVNKQLVFARPSTAARRRYN